MRGRWRNRYREQCLKLLSQYTSQADAIASHISSVDDFVREYKMDCPAALRRIRERAPATVRGSASASGPLRRLTVPRARP